MKKLYLLVFVMVFAIGCTAKETPKGSVVAKVGSETITKEQLTNELNKLPEWARSRFSTDEGKKQFLDEIIKKELIYQDAKKKGMDRDDKFKKDLEEFKIMTMIKMTLDKEIEEKAKVDPKEAKDFYDKHQDQFILGLQVSARHILVETESEAQSIIKRLRQGENFAKLAEKFSKDKGTAKNGGDLGFFERGRMVPEFEKVAFSMKPGEISNPVASRFGFHVIEVTDRKEGRSGSFDEVKEGIAKQLMMEKQRTLFDTYIEGLKKTYKIETAPYEAELKSIKVDIQPQAPGTK
ncbi:MAG: peptidylprolyl isomerase [Nitrospirae bacterium]|nr:peptidylprolyl isomerase [Nitrospirota bacterium]